MVAAHVKSVCLLLAPTLLQEALKFELTFSKGALMCQLLFE